MWSDEWKELAVELKPMRRKSRRAVFAAVREAGAALSVTAVRTLMHVLPQFLSPKRVAQQEAHLDLVQWTGKNHNINTAEQRGPWIRDAHTHSSSMSRRPSLTEKTAFSSDLFDKGIATLADKLVTTTIQGGRQLSQAVVETIAPAPAAAPATAQSLAPSAARGAEGDDGGDRGGSRKGKRRGSKHRHGSRKHLLSDAMNTASEDERGSMQGSYTENVAMRRADSSLKAISKLEESVDDGSMLDGVARKVYREQLSNAQIALGATRDELARMMQDREEEIGREREKRERVERELRHLRRKADDEHRADELAMGELRKQLAERTNELDAARHETTREKAARARDQQEQQEQREAHERANAAITQLKASMETEAMQAAAAAEAAAAEAASQRKEQLKRYAALQLQNGALRIAMGKSLEERARLSAHAEDLSEQLALVTRQLEDSRDETAAGMRRETELKTQVSKARAATDQLKSALEAERRRASDELMRKDTALADEQQLSSKLAEQLREARAEAVRALQHGAAQELERSQKASEAMRKTLLDEQQLSSKLAEQLREARAEALRLAGSSGPTITVSQGGAPSYDANGEAISVEAWKLMQSELSQSRSELERERKLGSSLATELRQSRAEAARLSAMLGGGNNEGGADSNGATHGSHAAAVAARAAAARADALQLELDSVRDQLSKAVTTIPAREADSVSGGHGIPSAATAAAAAAPHSVTEEWAREQLERSLYAAELSSAETTLEAMLGVLGRRGAKDGAPPFSADELASREDAAVRSEVEAARRELTGALTRANTAEVALEARVRELEQARGEVAALEVRLSHAEVGIEEAKAESAKRAAEASSSSSAALEASRAASAASTAAESAEHARRALQEE